MASEKVPHNKTTVTMMVILIALFVIGIILRWDYISREVSDSFKSRFSTEEKAPSTETLPEPASAE